MNASDDKKASGSGVPQPAASTWLATGPAIVGEGDKDDEGEPRRAASSGCTIRTTETEVSNGFVKDGTSLPYVFETSEPGNKKRSSRILPVCGMCGKKFVCVTTMKRHLVTHTGEKPFNCKVCGKQYTQKGNLRVHERTHRNDRPFECDICKQKFYRKEPMQKHQWRQHGIAYNKARPNNMPASNITITPVANNNAVITAGKFGNSANNSLPTAAEPASTPVEQILASDDNFIAPNSLPQFATVTSQEIMDHLPQFTILTPSGHQQPASIGSLLSAEPGAVISFVEATGNASGSQLALTEARFDLVDSVPEVDITVAVETSPHVEDSSVAYLEPEEDHLAIEAVTQAVASFLNDCDDGKEEGRANAINSGADEGAQASRTDPVAAVAHDLKENPNASLLGIFNKESSSLQVSGTPVAGPDQLAAQQQRPMKLKMKFAQAYMNEVKAIREREERGLGGRGECINEVVPESHILNLDTGLGDICLSSTDSSGGHDNDSRPVSNPSDDLNDASGGRHQQPPKTQPTVALNNESHTTAVASSQNHENVECQCKSCGAVFSVMDPYNFRCEACHAKYTSLPTHVIADPLQCIGCMEIFAHKPALKLHQSSEDRERPFKCCRCGFEFRQKAHLQKHQWRIHRKKSESDNHSLERKISGVALPTTNPAQVAANAPADNDQPADKARPVQQENSSRQTATNNVGPTAVIHLQPQPKNMDDNSAITGSKPLDLSPTKMYGTAGSITRWVEQVETARTPIVPDITIHRKPMEDPGTATHLATNNSPTNFSIQIIESPSTLRPVEQELHRTQQQLEGPSSWPPAPLEKPAYAIKSKPVLAAGSNQPEWKNGGRAGNPLLNSVTIVNLSGKSDFAAAPDPPTMAEASQGSVSIVPSSLAGQLCRPFKRPRTDLPHQAKLPSQISSVTITPSHATLHKLPATFSAPANRSSYVDALRLSGPDNIRYINPSSATSFVDSDDQPADLSTKPKGTPDLSPSLMTTATKDPEAGALHQPDSYLTLLQPSRSSYTSLLQSDQPANSYSNLLQADQPSALNLTSSGSQNKPFDYSILKSDLIMGQLQRMKNQDERSGI